MILVVYTYLDMQLPKEIELKILELIGLQDLNRKNLSTYTKRINEIRKQLYKLSEDFARAITSEDTYSDAYFAYNFPMNLMKAMVIAEELKHMYSAIFTDKKILSILDLGCGEGAGMLGFYYGLKNSIEFSLAGIDASKQMFQRCRTVTNWLKKTDYNVSIRLLREKLSQNLFKKITQKYDVVIFANSLAEIIPDNDIPSIFIDRILKYSAQDTIIIIIEPALKKYARRLMRLREEIIMKKKGYILLPCLHENECSLLKIRKQEEWCHQSIFWNPPGYMEILNRGLNRDINYLKFSYLVISKKNYRINFDINFLVISSLLKEKGKKRCFLCTPTGRIELVRLNKTKTPSNREFDEIKKGDIIAIKNVVQSKPNYWQITEDTQIEIL